MYSVLVRIRGITDPELLPTEAFNDVPNVLVVEYSGFRNSCAVVTKLFDRSRLMSEVQISKIVMNKLCTLNFCFVVG